MDKSKNREGVQNDVEPSTAAPRGTTTFSTDTFHNKGPLDVPPEIDKSKEDLQ